MPPRSIPPAAALLVAAAVVITLLRPVSIGNDGEVRFRALTAVLRDGRLDATKYPLAGPLAAAPFWLTGEAAGRTELVTWAFNGVVFLAGAAGLWAVVGRLLPAAEATRFAMLLLFGSMFPWHAMTFGAETFTAVGLGLGLAMLATRTRPALGGVLCVWGTANMPASAVGLGLACLVLCWHRKRLRYLLLPAAAAAVVLAENWARRGHPLATGYVGEAGFRTVLPYSGLPGFSYPLFFGVLSLVFSFGKGLLFFAPGLFARYPGPEPGTPPDREEAVRLVYHAWVAVVVGLALVYARWWAWYGGAAWGPRFLLFASIPAALVLARWAGRSATRSPAANVLVLAALALSCWVGANGHVYREYGHEAFWENDFALEHLTWAVPECSVLWRPFVVPHPLTWAERARLAAFALAFAYLAWPVARVLIGQVRDRTVAAWRTLRTSNWRL